MIHLHNYRYGKCIICQKQMLIHINSTAETDTCIDCTYIDTTLKEVKE